jgi:hypothetical protein
MLPESIAQSPDFFFRQVGYLINLLKSIRFEMWDPSKSPEFMSVWDLQTDLANQNLFSFFFNFKFVGPLGLSSTMDQNFVCVCVCVCECWAKSDRGSERVNKNVRHNCSNHELIVMLYSFLFCIWAKSDRGSERVNKIVRHNCNNHELIVMLYSFLFCILNYREFLCLYFN